MCPGVWAPSTTLNISCSFASLASSCAGNFMPWALLMWGKLMRYVSGVMACSKAATISAAPSMLRGILTIRCFDPCRRLWSSQPLRPPGCSMSVVSISASLGISSPLARRFMPMVAFWMSAMFWYSVLMSLPSFSLISTYGAYPLRRACPSSLQSMCAALVFAVSTCWYMALITRMGDTPMVPVLQYASSGGMGNWALSSFQ